MSLQDNDRISLVRYDDLDEWTEAVASEMADLLEQEISRRGQARMLLSGGTTPAGFDCSGLVTYAYQGSGLNLNGRTSSQITNGGRTISQSQAQPGDIVSWPGHIGIYAGNGQVIDASGSKYRVTERGIWGNPTFVTYR